MSALGIALLDAIGYLFVATLLLGFQLWVGYVFLVEAVRWLTGRWSGQQEYFELEERAGPPAAQETLPRAG